MAKRLIIALTLFALLWTGTFLHDMFGDDTDHKIGPQALLNWQLSSHHATEPINAGGRSTVEGHWHYPCVTSNITSPDASLAPAPGISGSLPAEAWSLPQLELLAAAHERPPPVSWCSAPVRIHLLNRVLLI
jgi:hypothetical protein